MMFLVDQDTGDTLIGYLVPDSPVEPGRYAVRVGGEEVFRGETDIVHADLVAAGRHRTGRCIFHITEAQVPGLPDIPELEVVDLVSGQAFYRRRRPETIVPKRVFRLETHLLPLTALDRSLDALFQLSFTHIDRVGSETVLQIFQMKAQSTFVSGRVPFPSVEHFLEKAGYESIVLLHDPFEELAERLLFLRLVAQRPQRILGERDDVIFADALTFAKEAELDTDKGLRRTFRTIDPQVAGRLANPITRQLAVYDPNEALQGSAVGKAVSALAGFKVVGMRRRPDLFAEALTDALGITDDEITIAPPIPAATELAERLRACREVEDLLEYDLALYHIVADAFEKSSIESYSWMD